ncbi:hypothetical protein [Sphingomonas sp. TX0522]|uniref:hypothetical protein n=1 Tax=Sphingomonas sp. TX0522 TaxID=2479205 RepID=UPI0018DF0991|nr:hypothetical protein [Sphingomonas sp. TX0522]MBI0530335.1 hypothetical protein [Sphingomonas sp. TX0522]
MSSAYRTYTDRGSEVEGLIGDTMRDRSTREATDNLLRAQLRAGQHLLDLPVARALGARLGLFPGDVRPAAAA